MAYSGTQWPISADGHEAVVVEVGGGLRTFSVNGVLVVDGYGPDEPCPGAAGQVLAPWPNRVADGAYTFGGAHHQLALTEPDRRTAIHGLVRWLPWRCVAHAPESVTVECALPAQPGYPWPVRLRTRWTVGRDGLSVEHTAVNEGDAPCPFGLGVHPYLMVPGTAVDDLVLDVPATSQVRVDERLLPVGEDPAPAMPLKIGTTKLDTCFGGLPRDGFEVSLTGPDRGLTLWADSSFRWIQVFTGDTLAPPRRRRAVAVEPMTCPPDAFRSGRDLLTLQPGKPWHGSWGIRPAG